MAVCLNQLVLSCDWLVLLVHRHVVATRVCCTEYPFSGAFAKLRKATIAFVMSVRPSVRMEQLAPTGWIFVKFDI
jgi:hypothetical protein